MKNTKLSHDVKVNDEVHKELLKLKAETRNKSLNSTIKYLLYELDNQKTKVELKGVIK